jgi:hypothetical protein
LSNTFFRNAHFSGELDNSFRIAYFRWDVNHFEDIFPENITVFLGFGHDFVVDFGKRGK